MSLYSVIRAPKDDGMPFSDFGFIKDLGLYNLFDLHTNTAAGEPEIRLEEFFTSDPDTMRMRQDMFSELIGDPGLFSRLCESFDGLNSLFGLQKEKDAAPSQETLLLSVLELEAYIDYMDGIRGIFSEHNVRSELLTGLWKTLEPLCTGEQYGRMRKEVKDQVCSVRNIRSISVGINLDAQMRPTEAGVLGVHEESYRSGDLIERLLRLDMKNDGFTCSAPLYPVNRKTDKQEQLALRFSVNSALNKILSSALHSWSHTVKSYVISSLRDMAAAVTEWKFVSACVNTLMKLKSKGYPLCRAALGEEDNVRGLYHPVLALLRSDEPKEHVVKNDLDFKDAGIYILTGPNQGGKSVYTQAVGILYAMFHLGLPLPAESATLRPVDAILTHFIESGQTSYRHGRLSAECDRLYKINQSISENSLFLFDEALSSTNPAEAAAISSEIIRAYSEIGARGIWTTHFHELCRLAKEPSCNSRIGSLTAAIDERSHERQFRIIPGDGCDQSYAADIAGKYGLSKDDIVKASKR